MAHFHKRRENDRRALLPAFAGPAAQAQDYSSKQLTFMMPFAAGGGTDAIARLFGQKLGERLGKLVVIENRAGAGTVAAGIE